jgi:RNA polymerase sigma-70 factor (ECF subfamily)
MYTDVTEYVMAAQEGDKDAFGHVVKSTTKGIYTFARHRVRNHDAAIDLVDETFILAWLRLDQLRNPRTFFSWAKQICFRLILTRNRSRRVHQLEPEVADKQIAQSLSPIDFLAHNETIGLLYEAINQFDSPYRDAMISHYIHGKTYKEIGKLTNTPEGTVRSRLHAVRNRIRASLTNSN